MIRFSLCSWLLECQGTEFARQFKLPKDVTMNDLHAKYIQKNILRPSAGLHVLHLPLNIDKQLRTTDTVNHVLCQMQKTGKIQGIYDLPGCSYKQGFWVYDWFKSKHYNMGNNISLPQACGSCDEYMKCKMNPYRPNVILLDEFDKVIDKLGSETKLNSMVLGLAEQSALTKKFTSFVIVHDLSNYHQLMSINSYKIHTL